MAKISGWFQEGAVVPCEQGSGCPTFAGAPDARTKEISPTTNYGSATLLRIDHTNGYELTSWLAFDLYNEIPVNSVIVNAKLMLRASAAASNAAGTFGIFRCLKAPNESQITWNKASTTVSWKSGGAKSSSDTEVDNDDPTKADRRTVSGKCQWSYYFNGTAGWHTLIPLGDSDFISLIQGWVAGAIGSARGLVFDGRKDLPVATTPSVDVKFFSGEYITVANRPKLWIRYKVGCQLVDDCLVSSGLIGGRLNG